jgi:hypothetical protein
MRLLSMGVRVSSAAAAAAVLGGVVALGVIFNFRSIGAHVRFVALSAIAVALACSVVAWFDDDAEGIERVVRAALIAVAMIVFVSLVLGAIGALTVTSVLGCQLALLALATAFRPSVAERNATTRALVPALALGVGVVIVAFVVGMGAGHSPLTAYDSLSYHLFFPARWLQEHRVFIVPTPFSDEAQAYQPGNGELFFAWLMLPFHGDLLARIGQVPFYVLGCGVLYMLARRLGAPPNHAIYPSLFFLVAPRVVEQATGANVDLICAVLFVAALTFGIVAVERDRARDWLFWGIVVGLFLGSKYLALVYAPLLALVPFVRGLRKRALWALPGLCALGLPWYVRNWIAAGSPIYPSSLAVGGVTIAGGAFSHAALTHSAFHSTDLRVLALSAIHAMGLTIFVVWLPVAIAAVVLTIRSRQWWPSGFVLGAAALTLPLCWIGVPDNGDSRFLLPGIVAAMIVFALPFSKRPMWNGLIVVWYILGIAFIVVGARGELSFSAAPWFMGDWFTWEGVVRPAYIGYFAAAVLAATVIARGLARSKWRLAALTAVAVVGGVGLADGAERLCPERCDYLTVASPHIRIGEIFGWWWLEAHSSGASVAYTGDNLPYGLVGHHLLNKVYYVNIDRHADWRFDHYARAFKRRGPLQAVQLASASNVLDPITDDAQRGDAPRPRFERMYGDRLAWIHNLAKLHITYLCVFALNPYEVNYVWHNGGGFPIEDEWARADPNAFGLVFDNPAAHIYTVKVE